TTFNLKEGFRCLSEDTPPSQPQLCLWASVSPSLLSRMNVLLPLWIVLILFSCYALSGGLLTKGPESSMNRLILRA
ncbi:hypothetical protein CHARACLAT_026158, partial [Characodon lateralis]|nr:hypothetical protein [Characodon lateralis]